MRSKKEDTFIVPAGGHFYLALTAALTKLLFLAVSNLTKRWTSRIREWPKIYPQLLVFFEAILTEYV